MKHRLLALLAVFFAFTAIAFGEKAPAITSVHSKVLNGYERTKASDGTFKRESYALSNGGFLPGTIRDASIEQVTFPQLAGVLGRFLAEQNYHLAKDSKSADLLIVVYYGLTVPLLPEETALAVDRSKLTAKELADTYHTLAVQAAAAAAKTEFYDGAYTKLLETGAQSKFLGFVDALGDQHDLHRSTAAKHAYLDMREELLMPRYYIFVFAYDFRETVERNNRKLLWGTRLSIRAQKSAFDRDFATMLANAAKHFGQNTDGLLRKLDPEGRVEIGEMEVLGAVFQPAKESEEKERSQP